jgi:hypothetical protein
MACPANVQETQCKVEPGVDGCGALRAQTDAYTAKYLCETIDSAKESKSTHRYCVYPQPIGFLQRALGKLVAVLIALVGIFVGVLVGWRDASISKRRIELGIPPKD